MSTTNLNIFRNGTFTFEVMGARFTVHKDLVARYSKGLKKLMESGMQESQNGSAPLQDTDELTFGRFVEFMYTGDYNPAGPVRIETESREQKSGGNGELDEPASNSNELEAQLLLDGQDNWGISALARSTKKKKGKRGFWVESAEDVENVSSPLLYAKFPSLVTDVSTQIPLPTSSAFQSCGDWSLDYLPVFLSHARLYVFADTYDIPDLLLLAAARLHDALSQFQYMANSVTEITELVSYAYEHTPERSNEVDKLRTIVTQFCARHAASLIASRKFRALLTNGGDFVPDLIRKMCAVQGDFL